jgi:hypothetical protein
MTHGLNDSTGRARMQPTCPGTAEATLNRSMALQAPMPAALVDPEARKAEVVGTFDVILASVVRANQAHNL